MNKIPLSVPNITGNELELVSEVIKAQWVSTAGESIAQFEEMFIKYFNIKYAAACQSGTAGLHLCLRHYGIKDDDIVLVPTLTFIATVTSVIYQKAKPVFFDCDDKMGIDSAQIKKYIENDCTFNGKVLIENESGSVVKAIIPVHVFGDVCELDELIDLASKYNLVVIEDATESLGSKFNSGRYKGLYTGTVGNSGVFSFNGNKLITTGGGGMIISNNENDIRHMRYLSQQAKDDLIYFIHNEIGYNYRMTNVQAALGIGQFERIDEFIKTKRKNLKRYSENLSDCALGKMHKFKDENASNCWFYSFCLNDDYVELRDEIMFYLKENGIDTRPIWKLCHTQKPLQEFKHLDTKVAEDFYKKIINLPCSTNLTQDEVDYVCKILKQFRIK